MRLTGDSRKTHFLLRHHDCSNSQFDSQLPSYRSVRMSPSLPSLCACVSISAFPLCVCLHRSLCLPFTLPITPASPTLITLLSRARWWAINIVIKATRYAALTTGYSLTDGQGIWVTWIRPRHPPSTNQGPGKILPSPTTSTRPPPSFPPQAS